uniref:Uncharacterized protein n=1 Tax=Alexandrium andersonii TaxID=327968 RepID=A0A7S2MSM7_9DINO
MDELFAGNGTFKCNVYMVDETGEAPALDVSAMIPGEATARRLSRHRSHHGRSFRFMEHHGLGKPHRLHFSGNEVCLQRRSLLRFYDFETTEMWFCYLPEHRWAACAEEIRALYLEGLLPITGAALLIFALAYIMQNQLQFLWALSWVATFCVNLELGVASVAFMLNLGLDSKMGTLVFEALALCLVVLGATVAMLPHRCHGVRDSFPTFVTWYLLSLVILPCISLDAMSYWNTFPLLVDHWPVMLGLIGFALDALKWCLLDEAGDLSGFGALSARSSLKVAPGDYEYTGMRVAEERLA